jgi:F420-dependent oxidoreductase-like protein
VTESAITRPERIRSDPVIRQRGSTVQLGIALQYWGAKKAYDPEYVVAADRLGYHSIWAAEAWGSDAVTVLSYTAALTEQIRVGAGILQMPARTPAMTAMTATTLNELSNGRFILGLGLSGPQVVEGWHGVPYGKPLAKTREYVSIVRTIVDRTEPLEHDGVHYQIPYRGDDATGLGKPLKLMTHPSHSLPIYLAAIGPKNVRLTAEIADGWLPIFWSPAHTSDVFAAALAEGFAASGDVDKRSRFTIAPTATIVVTEDEERARNAVKPHLALYIGGMGSKGRNFYNDLAVRYGFDEAAATIQDHYLSGRRTEAVAAVPDELVDAVAIIGSGPEVRDKLAEWKESGVDLLLASTPDLATLRALPDLL